MSRLIDTYLVSVRMRTRDDVPGRDICSVILPKSSIHADLMKPFARIWNIGQT